VPWIVNAVLQSDPGPLPKFPAYPPKGLARMSLLQAS
jgi:hypothetical protein